MAAAAGVDGEFWLAKRRELGRARGTGSGRGDVVAPGGTSWRQPWPVDVWTTSCDGPPASAFGPGAAQPDKARDKAKVKKDGRKR